MIECYDMIDMMKRVYVRSSIANWLAHANEVITKFRFAMQ